MGNRLTKIYTRTGDNGITGLADGSRVDKDSMRIEVIGCTDELNSIVGMVMSHDIPDNCMNILILIQHDLFDLGGELAIPEHVVITQRHTERLELELDNLNKDLPRLKEFILPSGGTATSCCHFARSVCRRTERRCVSLNKEQEVNRCILTYLNRLSDLLFVIARVLSRSEGESEVFWNRNKLRP